MRRLLLLFICSLFFVSAANAQTAKDTPRVWEAPVVIPTYELNPPNPYPALLDWQRRKWRPVYPYAFQDSLGSEKTDKTWKAVYLENEYLKVTVLPELGGHVYRIFDKTLNRDIIYANPVMKYAMVALRGAWVSGGIEWNFPDGHTLTTVAPIDYVIRTEPDGSAAVAVGDTERVQGMQWQVILRLRPGTRVLESEVTLNNRLPVPGRYWYWSTAGAPAAPDLRFNYPMRETYPHAFWPVFKFPVEKGVDIGRFSDVPNFLSLFARDSKRDYFGIYYEQSDWGVVHVADHRELPGKKTWTWGTDDNGDIWIDKLTDGGGQYVEFQGGRFETQMEHQFIAPHRVEHFFEYWYGVNRMGGAWNEATRDAALRISVLGSRASISVAANQRFDGVELSLAHRENQIHKARVDLDPAKIYTTTIEVPAQPQPLEFILKSSDGRVLLRYRTDSPVDNNPDFKPATRPIADPKNSASAEQRYVEGLALDKKSKEREAREAYTDALKRDQGFAPAHIALGLSFYRSGEYEDAEKHLQSALVRNKDAGDAHYYLALVQRALGQTAEAENHLLWLVRAGHRESPARYVLGEIALTKGDIKGALDHLEQAVMLDPRDLKARTVLAVAERLDGNLQSALTRINQVVNEIPIDYFAVREQYLINKALGNRENEKLAADQLRHLLAREPDAVLELVFDYVAIGRRREAIDVLEDAIKAGPSGILAVDKSRIHPMLYYTLGYLYQKNGDGDRARSNFALGMKGDPAFVFPHRVEEIDVLRAAFAANRNDGRAAYYLGNVLASTNRDNEGLVAWRDAVRLDPANTVAQRNYARALWLVSQNKEEASAQYQRAIGVSPNDFRLYVEFDKLLTDMRATERRIKLLEGAPASVRAQSPVVQSLAAAYIDAGRFAEAASLLAKTTFTSGEGEDAALGLYRKAHLGLARKHRDAGDHLQAAAEFAAVTEFPRNFGVGRPAMQSQAQYYVAAAREYDAAGKTSEAERWWQRAATEELNPPSQPEEPWSEHYYYKAVALDHVGRKAEAKKLYERLALLNDDQKMLEAEPWPASGAIRFVLAGAALKALGRIDEARVALERALKLDPNNELALSQLAEIKRGANSAVRAGRRFAHATQTSETRLAQLVEANVIAVHAFQVLLAKTSGKGQSCFSSELSDTALKAVSEHQTNLLKSDLKQLKLWVDGHASAFNPSVDLQPILTSGLKIPDNAPVNVFTNYLKQNTQTTGAKIRALANLYQTVLEVERDGDRLQEEFAFYIGLGLPVYLGQFNLPGTDADLLATGQKLEGKSCEAPVGTSAAEWQIAGRKIWNWGEKNLHIRDERVLAAELLNEPEMKRLAPSLRALRAQRIAVVGHSFTMGLHWSSPSSFVPIVIDVFRRENPQVEFRQYAAGGLTASRAKKRFYNDVLAWKPDKVMLVVMTRTDEDYESLKQMAQGFSAAGIKPYMFDEVHDPAAVKPGTVERARKTAAEAGIEIVEVGNTLANSPERSKFICLDGIHMTEPYHRLMAKEWLKYLAGATNSLARPRMLIGENDPLTGFRVLRARYEAGARPPDDIDGWALSYVLTGDEAFAKKALQKIRETRTPEQVGSRTYPEYVKWSLAFDWLYNYPGFDNELKDRVASELLRAAEKMLQDQSLKEVQLAMYHNYPVRYLTLAIFALTAIEGHSSVEARAAPMRKHARAVLDHILDLTNFITPDGGYHESMDYQRITFAPLAMMAELLRTTANSDPALRYTLFQHYTDTYLYKVLPDGTTARDDDNEFPYLQWEDNICFGYAINRFKDPYAAWMLRKSGWPAQPKWRVAITQFLWDDPNVVPRNPADSTSAEIPRAHFFRGIGHLIMRDGFGPDSTWIQFNSGPYLAKHDHLDQNHFVIYHKGYLATESGADYTDTESPHYLNYYRRTIAHNSMLVYQPGEKFFWAENLWPAANDGGQRMDSSRYWNTVRSREDFARTRDLWATGNMEVTDLNEGSYVYARGNATNAYQPSKMERFTRELAYTPVNNILVVFDRVQSTNPALKKVWLLHGVGKPSVATKGKDVGHGGTSYANTSSFTYEDGGGRLRVHSLLPGEREVIARGGPDWEFWTPGDEFGGNWGSGKNWPLDPAEGGPLPTDPYLRKMWKTFWGEDFEKLLPSNTRAVVPASWRVEVSPAKPAKEDFFLHVFEIGDKGDPRAPKVELVDGANLIGALVEGGTVVLFATCEGYVTDGEATIPNIETANLLISGLKPNAKYELQMTGGRANWRGGLFNGVPAGEFTGTANESGVLYVPFKGQKDGRLRLRVLAGR